MSTISTTVEATELSFSNSLTTLEFANNIAPITVVDDICTVVADMEVTLVEATTQIVELEVLVASSTISVNDQTTIIEIASTVTDILEKCLQGPPGAIGPPGLGANEITAVAIDAGMTETITSVSDLTTTAGTWHLNLRNLVLDRQIKKNIDAIFAPSHAIRWNTYGINRKDVIAHTITITRTAGVVELKIFNNTISTLLVTGLFFPNT